MLSVITIPIMLSVIMLNVVMLSVIMLSVVTLSVVILNVFHLFLNPNNDWIRTLHQGILKGKYHCTIDLLFDWFGIVCFANKNKNYNL